MLRRAPLIARFWFVTVLFALPPAAEAGGVTLAWNRNPEPNASYLIAYGTQPGNPAASIDVGTQISGTIGGLVDGQRYYFVVYAYIQSALSAASNEVSTFAATAAGGAPIVLQPGPAPIPISGPIASPIQSPMPAPTPAPIGSVPAVGTTPGPLPNPTMPQSPTPMASSPAASGSSPASQRGRRLRSSQAPPEARGAAQLRADSIVAAATRSTPSPTGLEGSKLTAGCALTLSNSGAQLDSAAQRIVVSVTTAPGCPWIATSDAPWATVVQGASGMGSGTVDIVVAGKRSSASRTAQVHIGSAWFSVSQSGGGGAAFDRAWDVDRDGRGDFAVWRPQTGDWFILRSTTPKGAPFVKSWGVAGDAPVLGDYDGDGVGDLAVWRPANGTWYALLSTSHFDEVLEVPFGQTDGLPVPADYDGDGKTDPAVWMPSDGMWHIRTSSTGYTVETAAQWGGAGDTPLAGDFDGDGRADLACWRPSTGSWSIRLSHVNYAPEHTLERQLEGDASDDRAQAGDFDGDGVTDLAVWRKRSGTWHVLFSESDFSASADRTIALAKPDAAERPVADDYDGDGRTDVAAWHQAGSVWLVKPSVMGFGKGVSISFGQPAYGDIPVTR